MSSSPRALVDLYAGQGLRLDEAARSLAGALHERFDGVLDRIMVYAPYPVPAGLWREAGLGAT